MTTIWPEKTLSLTFPPITVLTVLTFLVRGVSGVSGGLKNKARPVPPARNAAIQQRFRFFKRAPHAHITDHI